MKRTWVLWALTIIVTLGSVIYQRMTGPTYDVRDSVEINGDRISYRLPRSQDNTSDAAIKIAVPDASVTGEIRWRRYRSYDTLRTDTMRREGNDLVTAIPRQPAAGKVTYRITLIDKDGSRYDLTEEPVIIRFKGPVPSVVLIPHVIFMFVGMLLATRAGLEAVTGRPKAYRLTLWTTGLLIAGGLIFGPIVQKYAFGAFWTGWPFGTDLTDTKTAFALLFWLVPAIRGRRGRKTAVWIVVAALVTFAVYLIPHSVMGSELDYTAM